MAEARSKQQIWYKYSQIFNRLGREEKTSKSGLAKSAFTSFPWAFSQPTQMIWKHRGGLLFIRKSIMLLLPLQSIIIIVVIIVIMSRNWNKNLLIKTCESQTMGNSCISDRADRINIERNYIVESIADETIICRRSGKALARTQPRGW